jgi:tetratricopeptide (TPR) repeat protein
VFHEIYADRICRRQPHGDIEFYATKKLGAFGSDLTAISWFFDKPYETPVATLKAADRSWMLGEAAYKLRAQGRFAEALAAYREGLRSYEAAEDWGNAAGWASSLSEAEMLIGEVAAAVAAGQQAVAYAHQSGNEISMGTCRARWADALHAAGRREKAELLFADAERRQKKSRLKDPRPIRRQALLYSLRGYQIATC